MGRPKALTSALFRGEAFNGINDILGVIRRHLDMDVAFVSEFVGDRRIFRHVDPPRGIPLQAGGSLPVDEGYCKLVVEGDLPGLIPDTSVIPRALAIPATWDWPIGAHAGVPIRLKDKSVYGSFCCFRATPNMSLNERDVTVMKAFAELVAHRIDQAIDEESARAEVRASIEAAIDGRDRWLVYQPIFNIPQDRVVGVEALSRFSGKPDRGPEPWLTKASQLGMLADLECAIIRDALADLAHIPLEIYQAINVTPLTVMDPRFGSLFADAALDRVVLEVTEHAVVADPVALADQLAPLRARGLRLAVDDAGAGYASLQHILNLKPDIVKLDMSLTRNVDTDPARQALAGALVRFAADLGIALVAEGIATDSELQMLRTFGVTLGQGFHLGRPQLLADVLSKLDPV